MENEILLKLIGSADGAISAVAEAASTLKKLSGNSSSAKKELNKLSDSFNDVGKKAEKTGGALSKITKSLGRIAFYRAIRSVIKDVSAGVTEGVQNLVQYSILLNNLDASHAIGTMSEFATVSLWVKNTVGSAVMPILQSLVPVVDAVAEAFIFATNTVNQFIKSLQGSATWTKALKYPVDYADKLNGVGRAAKEAKKQIFGFDELNIFKDNSPTGSGSANALDFGSMFEETEVSDGFSKLSETIRNNLANIELIVGDAAMAAGMILIATGHVGTGITAFAAGAALRWKAAGLNSDSLGDTIEKKLGSLVSLSAPTALALGTILLLSGHIGLGIAGIVMGIGAIGISGAFGWNDNLSNDIKGKLDAITSIVSLSTLALGVMLALTVPDKLPLAIGLVAAGAAGLATNAAVNWDWMGSTISSRLAVITAAVSAASLAIGAILLFASPSHASLGFGLMAAGALGLATSTNLDWENVPNKVKNTLGIITGIVSAASLALGAVLFFGIGDKKGIGLMLAGATGLYATAKMFNVSEWAKEKFTELDTQVDTFITDLLKKALDAGKDFVDGLKQGISDKWNSFKSWLSGKSLNINANVNASTYGFGSLPARAEGGFVDSGQMFVARENGIPEFVGSFGNRTAVANNAQIVEGIASGVESAMDNTNSVILQMANAIVNAIADKQINTQVISDRDIYRSAERGRTLSGATVIS